MPALTSAPISARDLEKKEQELIREFLAGYFTGTPHTDDNGAQVTFEKCAIEFNQVDVRDLINADQTPQPLIHWTFTSVVRRQQPDAGGMAIRAETLSTVWLQVAAGGRDNERDYLCRSVSDHFTELLEGRAKVALAAKGISRLRIMRGPVPMTMPGVQTRLCIVKAYLENLVPRRG